MNCTFVDGHYITIDAGSVVAKDVPSGVLAVGVLYKVIRQLDESNCKQVVSIYNILRAD